MLVSVMLIATLGGSTVSAEPELLAGFSMDTVNPSDGVFLAGYDYNRKCTGIHDDLFAKAAVFHDGKETVALVVIDAISIQYDTAKAIREAAAKQATGIPLAPERVIVQATHTHCAPDTIGIYGADEIQCGRDAAYMAKLVETAAAQVAAAAKALRPVRLAYAETECKGWVDNDSEPDILDSSVTVLLVNDTEGKPLATLTHFACHPTVLEDETLAGSDWVGYFYKAMGVRPGIHLFLQGAIGCWVQPKTPERSYPLAQRYGEDLAAKVLEAVKNPVPIAETAIRFANAVVRVPVENPKFQLMSALGLVSRPFTETVETEVAWFAVGSAQFATHFGETAPEYGFQTKERMKSKPKFVLGLGLDHLGYICPERYFGDAKIPHAKYLTSMSPGPKAGPVMMEALQRIIP
ncbi:MAG TPA: neutral/alkaline non-lysosomal ceramidase N-terminal domain-containing protein [Candidatus Hydrogenedentes bacterium]|nr:neutral/alkaline non-lysosomal ceramidase N-terminal domain-containing protein [Candidatus Hydrogenedentota bacterium]